MHELKAYKEQLFWTSLNNVIIAKTQYQLNQNIADNGFMAYAGINLLWINPKGHYN